MAINSSVKVARIFNANFSFLKYFFVESIVGKKKDRT